MQGRTSGVVFGERAGMRPSKVSKLRLGQQLPKEKDIRDWVAAAGESDAVADELIAELADAEMHTSSFERRLRQGQEDFQRDYNELVKQADTIKMIERSFIPRVLQTFDYAKAILFETKNQHNAADDVDASVAVRLECQAYLYDGKRQFEFLIDEAVLTRDVANPQVMHDQMVQLLAVLNRKNVRLGILPIYGKYHDALRNSFVLYGDVAFVETSWGDDPQTDEQWARFNDVMAETWQDAREGQEARRLITNAMEHHAAEAKAEAAGKG